MLVGRAKRLFILGIATVSMGGVTCVGVAHANGMGTPIEPAARNVTAIPASSECDVLVTTEGAAAITSDLQARIVAIEASNDIAAALANATISTMRKHGVVTQACPCADNTLSFVVATLFQEAVAAKIAEPEQAKAVELLREQLALELGYPQQCVASAIGEGLATNDEGTSAIGDVIDNGNRGFPGDPPSLLTDRASASGR